MGLRRGGRAPGSCWCCSEGWEGSQRDRDDLNVMVYICPHAARGGHLAVLQWARHHDCPWNEDNGVHTPLRVGTWGCYSGRGIKTARGTRTSVAPLLRVGTWRC